MSTTTTQYVYAYTRAQAIRDGVLCDVTPLSAPLGFRVPVAVTAGFLGAIGILPDEDIPEQDARVVAALTAAGAAMPAPANCDERVPFVAVGPTGPVEAVIVAHRGDDLAAVATIMLSYED